MHRFIALLYLIVASTNFCVAGPTISKQLVHLNEDNWKQVLNKEWMIEFHAPWCPACKDLQKAWNSFADWSKDLNIQVAAVDVTANPGLSGRFLVTALPTIYHVKDGVFRSYQGPRDKDDFISFVEDKKWTVVEAMPGWKHPDTMQMTVVAMFFRMSMKVRDLHNYMIEVKGLPTWASYSAFGVATLILGCILGFFIVCIIDCCFPAAPAAPNKGNNKKSNKKSKQTNKEEKDKESDDEPQGKKSNGSGPNESKKKK